MRRTEIDRVATDLDEDGWVLVAIERERGQRYLLSFECRR